MEWDDESARQPDGPLKPPERQATRLTIRKVKQREEREAGRRRFWTGVKRWALWFTAAAGAVIAASKLPEAASTLVAWALKFFAVKGGP